MRDASDSLAQAAQRVQACLQAYTEEPWRYDYFAVMRRLEASAQGWPRWGRALLPRAELLRVGQEPSLAFAPASLTRIEPAQGDTPARLRQQFFGYIGPNGPLPVHWSDYIQERAFNHGDRSWLGWLDMLTHRFALHFYRAWAQARPAVSLDRPEQDRFRCQLGALQGLGTAARQQRDAIADDARLYFSGWLTRQVRNADSVQAVLQAYFGVPVQLQPWVGHWMRLEATDCTRLGQTSGGAGLSRLGQGALLGRQVWDRQHRVRLYLGPLTWAQYQQLLPGGSARASLQHWMDQLLGQELDWDAQLVLERRQVPVSRLGQGAQLGWSSWLGERERSTDAADVRVPAQL